MALEQLQWEDRGCTLTYHEGIIADGFVLERCNVCRRYICYGCGTRDNHDTPLCITCAKKEIIDRYSDCIIEKYVYNGKIPARIFIGFWKWLSEIYELKDLWDLSCSRVISHYLLVKMVLETEFISVPENKDAKVGTVEWLIM